MVSRVYTVLVTVIVTYISVLFLLNRIPKFRVRSLGWFALRGVTIELEDARLVIGKVKINLHLLGYNTRFRGFSLDFHNIEVELFESRTRSGNGGKQPNDGKSIEDLLRLKIPPVVYEWIIRRKLLNTFSIRLFKASLVKRIEDESVQVVFDIITLRNNFNSRRKCHFAITLLNGYLLKDEYSDDDIDRNQIVRNIELSIYYELIASCTSKGSVNAQLKNFDVNVFLGKLYVDLNYLKHVARGDVSHDKLSTEKLSGKNKLQLNNLITLIEDATPVFESYDIKVEDFQLRYEDMLIKTSSATLSIGNNEKHIIKPKQRPLRVLIFLTSFKVFHHDDQCLEIPTFSFGLDIGFYKVLKCIRDLMHSDSTRKEKLTSLDYKLSITITKPTIDIYFDQLLCLSSPPSVTRKRNNVQDYQLEKHIAAIIGQVSHKINIIDIGANIHLPHSNGNKFDRKNKENLLLKISLLTLIHKLYRKGNSAKSTNGESNSRDILFGGIFKLRSFKVSLVENTINLTKLNLPMSFNLVEKSLVLQVNTKDVIIRSVNDMIFRVVKDIRTKANEKFNQKYSEVRNLKDMNVERNQEVKVETLDLFKILPPFISKAKVKFANIQIDVVCKDGLPHHDIFIPESNEYIDLGIFKRGVSVRLHDFDFSYSRESTEIACNINSVQAYTLSECNTELITDFDLVINYSDDSSYLSDMASLDSNVTDSDASTELKKVRKVLHVRDISLTNSGRREDGKIDKNHLNLTIPEIDGKLDIFLVWCTVYASSLFKNFKPEIDRQCSASEMDQLTSFREVVNMDLMIESVAFTVRLPNDVDILLELDAMRIKDVFRCQTIFLDFARLYVVHPSTKLWSRLLVFKSPQINVKKENEAYTYDIDSQGLKLVIPQQFLFYSVIDNTITFFKAVKQIKYNFSNLVKGENNYERLMPTAKPPVIFPKVHYKTKILGLILEDDPFEVELSCIFELGLLEQQERLKKIELFEQKSQEILSKVKPTIDEQASLTDTKNEGFRTNSHRSYTPKYHSPLRQIWKDTKTSKNIKSKLNRKHHPEPLNLPGDFSSEDEELSREEAEAIIKEAKDNLNKHFSSCWIGKYDLVRKTKQKSWANATNRAWGQEDINPIFANKFHIMNHSFGPKLLGCFLCNADIELDQARIDDVHQFLYDYGKKQPKFDYSILVPLYFKLRSSAFFVFLKDYTLPLVAFPASSDQNAHTLNITGNLVINEKLVTKQEEMRFIYVPFSPATASVKDLSDNFYSVFVPRTLTPVKTMVDLHCDLNTERSCMITWCKAYLPAIQMALAAFEKFTKPKVDDSPIGWWDKVALNLHGKATFNIANEICLHMKSSLNPYDITGRASGFVFCWKDNVSLRINDNDDSRDLVVLESDSFLLSIPNYSMSERRSWSFLGQNFESYSLDISSEIRKFQKKVIKLSSAERVRWILGVVYERNKAVTSELSDKQERTSEFRPHYDISITDRNYKYHKDSYEKYRSDYIHMALSVISTAPDGGSYNAAYLTPLTFHYFFFWWDTLTKHSTLPIRNGRLFSKDPVDISHIKMGKHVFTVKYQLILEPLSISHLYLHSSSARKGLEHHVAFTGLKGKFASCSIDLHQKKELLRYVNEKLGINNNTLHLKMSHGGIDIDSADIRFINAIFKEKTIRSYLMSQWDSSSESPESPSTSNWSKNGIENFNDWAENINLYDNDFSWIDADDFVELQQRDTLSPYPKIRILPFFQCPKFSYIREFLLHKEGPYPFGYENSHDCVIGRISSKDTQLSLLKQRKAQLSILIEECESKLEHAISKQLKTDELKKSIHDYKSRLETITFICESIKELMLSSAESSLSFGNSYRSSEPSYLSRVGTTASSAHSFSEMKEISCMKSSASDFHNRFIVHNPKFKWSNDLRDMFLEYIQEVGEWKSLVYFMGRKAIDLVRNVLNSEVLMGSETYDASKNYFETKYGNIEDTIDRFKELVSEIEDPSQEAENKYLLYLIHPQIQLTSNKDTESCAILTSRDIQMRIVSVNIKGMDDLVAEDSEVAKRVESRTGVLFKDSHLYIFKKEPTVKAEDSTIHFGDEGVFSDSSWPPWVGIESCYDPIGLEDQLVCERTSMGMILSQPNYLVTGGSKMPPKKNEVSVYVPKMVIDADSCQYSTLYYIVTDLLIHSKTDRDVLMDKLSKIVSLSDANDFQGLDQRVKTLQDSIRSNRTMILRIQQKDVSLNENEKQILSYAEIDLEKMKLELMFLMRSVCLRSSKLNTNKENVKFWNISIGQIIWHLLSDQRKPFIDIAVANSKLIRIDSTDSVHSNKIEVEMVQAFNLIENTFYPDLLRPYVELKDSEKSTKANESDDNKKDKRPIVAITWKMLAPIGGISIIQQANFNIQPIKIQLDYETARNLFSYVFPKDEAESLLASNLDDDNKDKKDTKQNKALSKIIGRSKKSQSLSDVTTSLYASDDMSMNSDMDGSSINLSAEEGKLKKSLKNTDNTQVDDVSLIMSRSSKYLSIVSINMEECKMSISFKAPKHLLILDVHNLDLTVPTLEFRNKLWSGEDFVLKLRKEVIRIILTNTGRIIGNKFKHRRRKIFTEPLKQISNYGSYMTLQDLQSEGRSRDKHSSDTIHHHHHKHHHHDLNPGEDRNVEEKWENILENIDEESSS